MALGAISGAEVRVLQQAASSVFLMHYASRLQNPGGLMSVGFYDASLKTL